MNDIENIKRTENKEYTEGQIYAIMKLAETDNYINTNLERVLPNDVDTDTAKTEMTAFALSDSKDVNKQTNILKRAVKFFKTELSFLTDSNFTQKGKALLAKLKDKTPEGKKILSVLAAALIISSGLPSDAQAVPVERIGTTPPIRTSESSVKIHRINSGNHMLCRRITRVGSPDQNTQNTQNETPNYSRLGNNISVIHSETQQNIKAPQYISSKSLSQAENVKFKYIVETMMARIQNNLYSIGYVPAKPILFSFDKKNVAGLNLKGAMGLCSSTPNDKYMYIYLDRGLFEGDNLDKSCEALLTHEMIHSLHIDKEERTPDEQIYAEMFGDGTFGHQRNFRKAAFKYDEKFDIGVSDMFVPEKEQLRKLASMSWSHTNDNKTAGEMMADPNPVLQGYYENSGESIASVTANLNWVSFNKEECGLTQNDINEFNRITNERIEKRSMAFEKESKSSQQMNVMEALAWEYRVAVMEDALNSTPKRHAAVLTAKNKFILQGLKTGLKDVYTKAAEMETKIRDEFSKSPNNMQIQNNGGVRTERVKTTSEFTAGNIGFSTEI